MARVYRRSYSDKKTGEKKTVKTYTLEYRDADGNLAKEATKIVRKPLAERALQSRLRDVERQLTGAANPGEIEELGSITLEELAEQYIAACRLRLKPGTCDLYSERLDFTCRHLGIAYPHEISTSMIDDYSRQRLDEGRSTRTPNLEVSILRRAMAWAVQRELIAENPLHLWKPIKDAPKKKRRALRPKEVQKLLEVAPLHRRMRYMVMLASGIRKTEAKLLLVEDLDTEQNILTVRPEIAKTGRGRKIPMPPALVAMIGTWLEKDLPHRRKRQDEYLAVVRDRLTKRERNGQDDTPGTESLRWLEQVTSESLGHRFLFANTKGMPLRCNVLRNLRADLLNAGIASEGVDLHALRYTNNTSMVAAGMNPATIRARMGHQSAAMTELYTDDHLISDDNDTSATAALLGLPDVGHKAASGNSKSPPIVPPTLQDDEPLRPTPEILSELMARYTNTLIGRIFDVSGTAVAKWAKAAGIKRRGKNRRIGDLPEWQIALLRADLRKAMDGE